jgi:DNA-binding FadR family transcriptional regulator
MVKADTKFHQRIAEASENTHLIDIIKQLQDKVLRYRFIYYTSFKRAEHMAQEHKKIFDAISAGKEEKAKSEAFNHVDRFMNIMIREVIHNES